MERNRACGRRRLAATTLLVLLFSTANQGLALINLQDKYVSQSSNYSDSVNFASNAVDGNINTISHTLCNGAEWWRVDLGTVYRLQRITIVNRPGYYGRRLSGAYVRAGLSADHTRNAQVGSAVQYSQASPGGQTLHFVPDSVVSARYASVDLYGNCLQLAEFRLEEEVTTSSGELVDFTCYNSMPVLPADVQRTYIGGYKGDVALLGDAVTFGRTFSTATGDGLPPCYCLPYPGDGRGSESVRQFMDCSGGYCTCGGADASCLYRVGAFYCRIDTGTTTEQITTITLNSDAVITPARQTITANQGESLTLHVSSTLSPLPDWRWRKTSASFNNWIHDWFGTQSPTIDSVSETDGGVYECHVPGERGQGRHAIFRVIIRGCPGNMWDPSADCRRLCPVCYNGGMCHDVTRECICAPGFSGSNCQIANGRNAWGMNGTLQCVTSEDRHGTSCRGRLFCLQDPFGCSCAAGYQGIGCDQECDEPDTFGPYCTQTCHCAPGIVCLTDTGECNDPLCGDEYCPQRCASGWKGRNCQVPTPCPDGYYGEICTQRCYCRDNQACDEETGRCPGDCADGYRGAACNQDGSRAIVSFGQFGKPNAGQPVSLRCETVGNPLPAVDDVNLYDADGQTIDPSTSLVSTVFNDYRRLSEYILTGDEATSGAQLACSLRTPQSGPIVESVTLDLYELPSLTEAPYQGPVDSSSIKVRWRPWATHGTGDGPVLRYEVHFRFATDDPADTTYDNVRTAASNASTSLVVGGLAVGTAYDFVVVVVREGVGGAGPPSRKVTIRTACATPTAAPTVQLDVLSGTQPRISWQFPPESTWQCESLQNVQVYTKQSSASEFYRNVYPATDAYANLASPVPCTSYDVYATFTNQDGLVSPGSGVATATTAATVPGPVVLQVFSPTSGSHNRLGVRWSAPSSNNCPLDGYVVSHSLTRVIACGSPAVPPVPSSQTVDSPVTSLSLNDLKPYSSYRVAVVAVNSAGNSTAAVFNANTSPTVPSFVPTIDVRDTDVTTEAILFRWDEIPCEDLNGPTASSTYRTVRRNLWTNATFRYSTNLQYQWATSLTECTTYAFQVAVANGIGTGAYSNATEVTTGTEVPSRVGRLTGSAVNGYPTVLRVQWDRPSGHCPIDHYTVSYDLYWLSRCEYPTSNRIEAGRTGGTEYNVTGLFPYSRYKVYVTATTSAGEGPQDVEYIYTAEAAPSVPPENVTVRTTLKRGLTFDWLTPSCPGRRGNIVGYTYLLLDLERGGANVTGDTASFLREASVGGLVPYTLYSIQVLARTSAGSGPYSAALRLRTEQAKPPQITSVTTPSGDATSISVRWPRPDPPNGIIIAYYVSYGIMAPGNQTITITEGLNNTVIEVELTDLVADSNYCIQVQAETIVNRGALSDPVCRITQEGIPSMPSSLRVVSRKQTELSVVWDQPTAPNGRITRYIVKYRVIGKPYDPDFRPPSEYTTSETSPEARERNILGLSPGTRYQILVSASTRVGEGPAAEMEAFTEPASGIPAPIAPTVDPQMSTGTTVVISIPAVDNEYVVSYLVKVRKMSSSGGRRRRRRSAEVEQEEFGSYDASPDHYWAGEVDKSRHTGNFEIGDNKTYSGYYNPPLQEGATYEIQTGSTSKTADSHRVTLSEPITVKAGDYVSGPNPPLPEDGGVAIGPIIGVVLVLLVATALIFGGVVMAKRRRARKTAKPFESVGMSKIDDSKFTKKTPESPQMKRVASEDALTNMAGTPSPGTAARPPSGASTLPADIHHKPAVRPAGAKPSPAPVNVEKLSAYVKAKKAKNNEGFRADYSGLPSDQIHSMDVAKKDENKVKNRYANIIAYDHSRVVLDKLEGDPHSDYINASYIDGYKDQNKYIASQGPNTASTRDMWRMIWQERTNVIVMVTHLVEGGKKKCEQYWPTTSKSYGGIEVTMESESTLADYIVRAFKVKKGNEERKLMQYHFTSWPDMGLPQYASPLLRFVAVVKEGCARYPDMGPIVVHCSAGVGRTGTFITIDAMLDQAEREGQVAVLSFVSDMRDRRVRMVQTQEQYIFIFDALLEVFLCGQTWVSIDNLRPTLDRLSTPSPTGRSTLMHDEFSKLMALLPAPKADGYRGGRDHLNANKNRFPDNLPLDRSRPYLMTMGAEDSTNYINASYINGYWKKDQYIITQIPLPNTSVDFWSMVYDYSSSTIVMLNPLDPSDDTMDRYWPEKGMSAYGPYSVQLASIESYDGTMCRTFTLNNMNKPKDDAHTVRQFEFQGWSSDANVPSDGMSLLKLIVYLERWLEEGHGGPVTVQCIDGVRCSGLFCAVLSMLDKIKAEKIVDVFHAVKNVRNNRPSGVSSLEQYKFCYDAALMHLQSFDIYENFR